MVAETAPDALPRGTVIEGDCLEVLRGMVSDSVETVITDPPAGVSFMGKAWDSDKGGRREWVAWLSEVLSECYRVAKPGASLLCWALPRTSHWTGCAIEDAGWYIFDCITALFGSGFPKSLDIGKAIDKTAGAERVVVGDHPYAARRPRGITGPGDPCTLAGGSRDVPMLTAPATSEACLWDGWGTALKPAAEFWWLARKPWEGSAAKNALAHGVAGIWVEGARVTANGETIITHEVPKQAYSGQNPRPGRYPANLLLVHDARCRCVGEKRVASEGAKEGTSHRLRAEGQFGMGGDGGTNTAYADSSGLETVADWECVDGCPCRILGEQSGESKSTAGVRRNANVGWCISSPPSDVMAPHTDSGTAARYFAQFQPTDEDAEWARMFYCAKASRSEREAGLLGVIPCHVCGGLDSTTHEGRDGRPVKCVRCHHPTVKPLGLLRYLARLTKTPTGGTVLDPFAGSGSILAAAIAEGRDCIGIEREPEYVAICKARVEHALAQARKRQPPLL